MEFFSCPVLIAECCDIVDDCVKKTILRALKSVLFRRYRLLDSLVVECWHRVQEVPGSIPSQGPRHTKDVIKMVPVVPLFGTEH